ncbi:hypothetical protein [Aquimarina macrocephali]|uniref:hypothetical protein n=1 Tax=Aquimarina macrocephali TaxID=666563 RepID=UPI0004635F74|nr:hypothetical protein [Aquimarina macrocephali]
MCYSLLGFRNGDFIAQGGKNVSGTIKDTVIGVNILLEGTNRETTNAKDDVFLERSILGQAYRLSVAMNF